METPNGLQFIVYNGLHGNHILRHKLQMNELRLVEIDLRRSNNNHEGSPADSTTRKSKIWSFFKHVATNGNTVYSNKFGCPKCNSVFNYVPRVNSTSAMKRHDCFIQYSLNDEHNPVTDDDIVKNLPSNIRKNLRRAEVAFVAKDLRPFAALGGEGMCDLLSAFSAVAIHHGETIPPEICAKILSDRTVVSKRAKQCAEKYIEELSVHLKKAIRDGGVTIAVDIWKDRNQHSYIGATLHHSCDLELHEHLLAVHLIPDGLSHTAENIRPIILNILERFHISEYLNLNLSEDVNGLSCHITFISDRGSNILLALSDYEHIHCAAHLLNSIVKEMCKCITAMLTSVEGIVAHFHHTSSPLSTKLRAANATRWNSNLEMFESIETHWDGIRDALRANGRSELLRDLKKIDIEHVVDLLTDFKDATLDLEWSSKPTLHLVQPWMHELLSNHLLIRLQDSTTIKQMKLAGAQYIEKKFQLTKFHKAATFFHPNLKELKSMEPNTIIAVKKEVEDFIVAWTMKNETVDIDIESSPQPLQAEETSEAHELVASKKRRVPRNILGIYGTVTNELSSTPPIQREQTIRQKLKLEMSTYSSVKMTTMVNDFELLGWWRDSANTLPTMSKFSRFILAIPATSSSAERWFSYGGMVENKLRQRISPETLESLLFLKSNWKYIDIVEE